MFMLCNFGNETMTPHFQRELDRRRREKLNPPVWDARSRRAQRSEPQKRARNVDPLHAISGISVWQRNAADRFRAVAEEAHRSVGGSEQIVISSARVREPLDGRKADEYVRALEHVRAAGEMAFNRSRVALKADPWLKPEIVKRVVQRVVLDFESLSAVARSMGVPTTHHAKAAHMRVKEILLIGLDGLVKWDQKDWRGSE